jgi:uncharacterized repeat protein (TIGR03803 family)
MNVTNIATVTHAAPASISPAGKLATIIILALSATSHVYAQRYEPPDPCVAPPKVVRPTPPPSSCNVRQGIPATRSAPVQDGQPFANSVTFANLVNFNGIDGNYPFGNLTQGIDGDLYGVTLFGDANAGGTLYRVTAAGALDVIYNFCSQPNCTDGNTPAEAGLALGSDGNLYGATMSGGASAISGPCAPYGCGTIFKITPSGTLTTIYNFCSQPNCADGDIDYGGVVRGVDGNFYGTTPDDGANGYGTVFKITPAGAFTTLYSFCSQPNCADGDSPYTGLLQGADGNLSGMTSSGGANSDGTIFKLTLGGTLTTVHSFNGTDGSCGFFLCAPLIQGAKGNLYGTTPYGGANGAGVVFEITSQGTFTVLYNFCSLTNCADGAYPYQLAQATDGSLYGATTGGADGLGTLFKLAPGGALTTLHVFDGIHGQAPGGANPFGLSQATNGTLYGVTEGGGIGFGGTVFSLGVGLGPFVETLPVLGKAGATVNILGTNLTGATGVSFNGAVAVFEVISSSQISATVPPGATTGFVTVTTSSGSLKSNTIFRVR